MKSSDTINVINPTKVNAARKRSADAAAGLLRIDGQVVVAMTKARELGISPRRLRELIRRGYKTTEALRAVAAK